MLDERGVIWDGHCEPRHTWYDSPTMGRIIVFETQTGGLMVKPELMTPEQVIAATLPDAGGAFDVQRYSKVCRLLEQAMTTMSEWGT
jgi:hypothetical protein